MWIWIGGLIVFGGGLLALAPGGRAIYALRRRVRALAPVRLGARPPTRRAAGPAWSGSAVYGGAMSVADSPPATAVWDGAVADPTGAGGLVELELAREVKYRELRELELDYGTGKLSREDYEATGGALRTEALAILDRLERLSPGPSSRLSPGSLEQHDRVHDEQDREEDGPAVEVALDH